MGADIEQDVYWKSAQTLSRILKESIRVSPDNTVATRSIVRCNKKEIGHSMSGRPNKRFPVRRVKALPLVIAGALLASCATMPTAKLSTAAALAKAGEVAASQMQRNVTISSASLDLFVKAVAFNDGFNATPAAAGSTTLIANVKVIQGNLVQYENLLQSLSSAYSAMDDLAEYGASTDLDSAVSNLASDTETFSKKVGKEITIPADVTKGLQESGNVVVGSVQTGKVIKASAQIESILEKIVAILSEPTVRSAITPIQPQLQGVVGQAAFILYTQGVYTYRPILDELGAPLGLESSSNADAIVRSNKRVEAGLAGVVNQTVNSQIASATEAYDQGLAALRALEQQHKKLQSGEAITLQNLSDIVANLRALAQVSAPPTTGIAK